MKKLKIHYRKKYGTCAAFCGTRRGAKTTRRRRDVTCLRCRDKMR